MEDMEVHDIGWRPLSIGWVRLNTYGTRKEGRHASCGGFIRWVDGQWFGEFSKFLGLVAALENLNFACSKSYKKIELHLDFSVTH
jgi:hypothetical protein